MASKTSFVERTFPILGKMVFKGNVCSSSERAAMASSINI